MSILSFEEYKEKYASISDTDRSLLKSLHDLTDAEIDTDVAMMAKQGYDQYILILGMS